MVTKYGFVYIWRDRKHYRFYLGSHWGTEDDGYICSSTWMLNARARRPLDFKRRILKKVYTNRSDTFLEEQQWLGKIKNEELGKRYYNLCKNAINTSRHRGKKHTKETKDKISAKNKGKVRTVESRNKISIVNKERVWYNDGVKNYKVKLEDINPLWNEGRIVTQALLNNWSNFQTRITTDSRKKRTKTMGDYWASQRGIVTRGKIGFAISKYKWWSKDSVNKKSKECPGEGWVQGRIGFTKHSKEQISNSIKRGHANRKVRVAI